MHYLKLSLLAAPVSLLFCLPVSAQSSAAWQPVPPMNWSGIKPTDFADNELDIPYLLQHFHRIANAVVETGPNRGFLDIKVAREPKDNQPYNARILESNLALSYFYGIKRPWNPYYGSPAVRQRLESMLSLWCAKQGPDGRFSEYSPTDFSLAPTGFGVRAMSQTLEILSRRGGSTIDAAVLARTFAAQRKAILSLLTLEDNIKWGREYSNQYSGVYQAALSYLAIKPDAEMKAALDRAVRRAAAEHQSPAGFMYEWGGSDIGYSGVHDNNLRLAWFFLTDVPTIREPLLDESRNWYQWLGYNLVRQPDGSGYLSNSGINTRTGFTFAAPTSRPLAEILPSARPFSLTKEERAMEIASRRAKLAAEWPRFKELVVPSAYSYDFGGFFTAYRNPDIWFPTEAQKSEAVARLPYLASRRFVHQANDPRPYSFTFVRRPTYYAIFNSGKIRRPEMQVYGLGLVWNDKMGSVLQSVSGTEWQWGTRPDGAAKVMETKDLLAQLTLGGKPIATRPGTTDYADNAPVMARYALGAGGSKTVAMNDAGITVAVQQTGGFQEQIPLLKRPSDTVEQTPGRITLRRGDTAFVIAFDPSAQVEIQPAKPFRPDLERFMVTIMGRDRLTYSLRFE